MTMHDRIMNGKLFTDMCEGLPQERSDAKKRMIAFNQTTPDELEERFRIQKDMLHESIGYRVCALEDFDYPCEFYDFIISNLVLHYVDDLNCVFRDVYQALKPDGVFLFNIEHPTFTASPGQDWIYQSGKPAYWPVDRYFYPGQRETNFLDCSVKKYHHTLTQILGGMLDSGFTLEAVEEAMPSEEMAIELPDEMRRPMMLLVKGRKKKE